MMKLQTCLIGALVVGGSGVLCLLGGCGDHEEPGDLVLDRLFVGGWRGVTINHFEYFVAPTPKLREGVTAEQASQEILLFLRKGTEAKQSKMEMLTGDLRRRDYWALVLASLNGIEFHLMKGEDVPGRELKINKLIETLEFAMGQNQQGQ